MAFTRENFAPISVGLNNVDTPNMWSYKTTDTTAEVFTTGYFDELTGTIALHDLMYLTTPTDNDLVEFSDLAPITIKNFSGIAGGNGFFVNTLRLDQAAQITHFYQMDTKLSFTQIFGTITQDITMDPVNLICKDNALNEIMNVLLPITLMAGDQFAVPFDPNGFAVNDILRVQVIKPQGVGEASMQFMFNRI